MGSHLAGRKLDLIYRGSEEMKKLALEEETTVVLQSRIHLTGNIFQCKPQENKTQTKMMQDVSN